MSKRAIWITIFLTLTGAAVGEELWASFDASSNTVPWTFLVVEYIPPWIGWPLIALLVCWLPAHFAYWYRHRKDV